MNATVLMVARREFLGRVWSRRVLVGSVAVAVLLVVFLFLQAFVFGHVRPVRVGLAGQAIALADGLPQETASLGVTVAVSQVDSVSDGVAAVRDGQLDVLVSGARAALHVTVDNRLDPQLRTTLNGLVRQQVLAPAAGRIVFPRVEIDIFSMGKSLRLQVFVHFLGAVVLVDPYPREVSSEGGLHLAFRAFRQGRPRSPGGP